MSQGNMIHEIEHNFFGVTAAGSTTINNDVTLPEGTLSVDCIVNFDSTVTADANSLLKVYMGDASDHSDATEVTALTTAIVAGMASKHVRLELVKPMHKYLRFSVIRGGGSDSIAILNGDIVVKVFRKKPDAIQSSCYSRSIAISPGP